MNKHHRHTLLGEWIRLERDYIVFFSEAKQAFIRYDDNDSYNGPGVVLR